MFVGIFFTNVVKQPVHLITAAFAVVFITEKRALSE
jgi:hypothetical protein